MTTDTDVNHSERASGAPRPGRDIALVVLDMAGTTVADDGLVLRAFGAAATAAGLPPVGPEWDAARQYVVDTMGQSKIEVFRALFGDESRAQAANAAFERSYDDSIDDGVTAIPAAAETMSALQKAGLRVALTTGFSSATQQRILRALRWEGLPDVVLAPGDGGRGRPYPDLVLNALLRTGIDDVARVAVVGDTSSDVLSGRRAGAGLVVGVLTGAHDRDTLLAAGASHVVDSVADLPGLLLPS